MSKEIKRQIDDLFHQIEELQDPTCFVLNPKVMELNEQVFQLQSNCEHSFLNGVCEFCYKEDQK